MSSLIRDQPVERVRNARVPGRGELVDLVLEAGQIQAVVPSAPGAGAAAISADGTAFDAAGRAVLPAFVEPHVHLDKAYLLDRLE